jgi:putative chitinase
VVALRGRPLSIACEHWVRHDLTRFADQDDIETVTRRINGGLNGLADCKAYLAKAKQVLGIGATQDASAIPTNAVTI